MRAAGKEVLHSDRFEVKGTLGAGGMGAVYRAFDRRLGHEVALKTITQASGSNLYRFKREFRTLADIVHPNLVALHELHTTGDEWFITMELVEGVSFIDWVRPVQPNETPSIDDNFVLKPQKAIYRLLTWTRGAFELEPPDERQVAEEITEST